MNKNKYFFAISSLALFFAGLLFSFAVGGSLKNIDKYHWLILLPIILPLIGVVLGIVGVVQARRFMKLIPLLCVLANLGLAAVIFIAYSFSYWQF